MNFEPLQVLKTALDFYASAGIISASKETVRLNADMDMWVSGDRQRYEQINLFIFGHLIPDYIPFEVNVSHFGHNLKTSFSLPKASSIAYYNLIDQITTDQRLFKLVSILQGKITHQLTPPLIVFEMPLDLEMQEESDPLDAIELKRKYETRVAVQAMIDSFLNNADKHILLLESSVDSEDFAEAHRHLQVVKQGAMNICANELVKSLKKLETNLSESYYQKAVEQIPLVQAEYLKIVQYLTKQREAFYAKF